MDAEIALRQLIEQVGLSHLTDNILTVAKPAIAIATMPVEDDIVIPIGTSKFGSKPDLPPAYEWPTWKDESLAFVGQINLADCAQFDVKIDLPKKGLLYFFNIYWKWGDYLAGNKAGRVLYHDSVSHILKRREPPEDLPKFAVFNPCYLTFSEKYTVPPVESRYVSSQSPAFTSLHAEKYTPDNHLSLSSDDEKKYWHLRDKVLAGYRNHQLFGYPYQVQTDLEAEFQNPALWKMLLQLDTDENANMMWGDDSGLSYYWIQENDLKNRKFDDIWWFEEGF